MLLDLNAFRRAPVRQVPYPHIVVPNFLPRAYRETVMRDFPAPDIGGLFLPDAAPMGKSVARIVEELESDAMRGAVEEKFDLDLRGRPALVSLRSRCGVRDGRIHTDEKFKLATLLLYLNGQWAEDGGRLRILNSSEDIADYETEIPPDGGTLVAFKVQKNSWHGHKPFSGPYRCIMLDYCHDMTVRNAEAARLRIASSIEKAKGLFHTLRKKIA